MIKFLKKIFGVKDKEEEKPSKSYIPKDLELEERNISPLLTEEKQSVPIEENVIDIVQPEELIAPTLERQDDELINKIEIEMKQENTTEPYYEIGKSYPIKNPKKSTKPKKQAKKKDNRNPDDDKSSWPKGNNFSL